MRTKRRYRFLPFVLLATMNFSGSASFAAPGNDSLTRQALSLYKDGKLEEACELEDKVVSDNPEDWLAHATMSYLYWQQGNVPDALAEGQRAAKHAKTSTLADINLANMYQTIASYADAIPFYENARKLDPTNWMPWIGLARCYIGSDKQAQGLAVLQEMSAQKSDNYDFNYKLGEAYMIVGKPDLAVEPLTRASAKAATSEQKSASQGLLMSALLKANKFDRARSIEAACFNKDNTKDGEAYVRAAFVLAPAQSPAQGKELLSQALANLKENSDSETFFRLGLVFQTKAAQASADATKSGAWLELAARSFKQAIEFNPSSAKCHLALAGIYDRQNNAKDFALELYQAKSCDQFDLVAPFVGTSTDQAKQKPSPKGANKALHLADIHFRFNGVTCGCQTSRLDDILRNLNGAALVNFPHMKPYEGDILVDPTRPSVAKEIAVILKQAFADTPASKPQPTFEINSQKPIATAADAIAVTNSARYGDVLDFRRTFTAMQPLLPDTQIAEKPGQALQ